MDFKLVKNPLELLLFRLGFKDEILLKTKRLGNFNIKNTDKKINIINLILNSNNSFNSNTNSKNLINFINMVISNEEVINLNGINYWNNNEIFILAESFFDTDIYSFSNNLKDKVILDIGGNIGDTSLQFAKKGALIYSFEPLPPIYDMAIKNIDLNFDLKNNIHFYNYAISGKSGKIKIAYANEGSSGSSSIYSDKGVMYEVDAITINDVLTNFCPNFDLLKIDCEGSEYDIILNSDLSMFKEIILEYHQFITGIDYHVLIDKLESQNFFVDKVCSVPSTTYPIEKLGIIKAINKKFI